MGRIFRKNQKVVVEGIGRYDADDVVYTQNVNNINVFSESENKNIFNAQWQSIKNEQNQGFNDVTSLINYLNEVFNADLIIGGRYIF